jgi:hypothetical protein
MAAINPLRAVPTEPTREKGRGQGRRKCSATCILGPSAGANHYRILANVHMALRTGNLHSFLGWFRQAPPASDDERGVVRLGPKVRQWRPKGQNGSVLAATKSSLRGSPWCRIWKTQRRAIVAADQEDAVAHRQLANISCIEPAPMSVPAWRLTSYTPLPGSPF